MTDKKEEIRTKVDLKELDNLPETIEDIEENPILKPLVEFHKQATMLEKDDKIEANFLRDIKEDIKIDMDKGIYDNSYIVKKFKNLEREYERLILIYSRYTDLADEKIVEIKKIVEKYYITKKENKRILEEAEKYYTKKLEENELKKIKKEEIEEKKEKIEKVEKKDKIEVKEEDEEFNEFKKRKGIKNAI